MGRNKSYFVAKTYRMKKYWMKKSVILEMYTPEQGTLLKKMLKRS